MDWETLNWSTKPTIEQLKNLIKDGGYLRFDKNLKSIMKEIEEKLKNKAGNTGLPNDALYSQRYN